MCTSSTSINQFTRTLLSLPPHVATKLPIHLISSQLTIENMTRFIEGAYDAIRETSSGLRSVTTTTATTTIPITTESHHRLTAFLSDTSGSLHLTVPILLSPFLCSYLTVSSCIISFSCQPCDLQPSIFNPPTPPDLSSFPPHVQCHTVVYQFIDCGYC